MSTVHCTVPDCDASVSMSSDLTGQDVYDVLKRFHWDPAPAKCRDHAQGAAAVYERMSEDDKYAAVMYLLEQGRHLEDLPYGFTTDDAFVTAETLIEAYQSFVLPYEAGGPEETVGCSCGNSRHPEGEK